MKLVTLYGLLLFFMAGFMAAAATLLAWVAFSALVGALKGIAQ